MHIICEFLVKEIVAMHFSLLYKMFAKPILAAYKINPLRHKYCLFTFMPSYVYDYMPLYV